MMHQLDTVLGGEDLYDLLELLVVDAKNHRMMAKRIQKD